MERQDGVLSRHQALEHGLTKHQWDRRLATRRWRALLPGVAVSHQGGTTERQRAWAAVLHAGDRAMVSGNAALSLAGLSIPRLKVVDVAVPLARRVTGGALDVEPAQAVVIRRVQGVEHWRREVRGLPVATTHAAVLHAVAWATSDRDAEWRIAASVQRRITAVPSLRAALARMPALKRRALAAAVLDDVELGAHAGTELQFLRFCRAHQLPLPDELQVRVRVGKVHYLDARYRRQRVTVEVDGAHHRDVETWEADALRTLRVVAAMPGESVVRLTTGLLRHDGDEVAGLLRAILARP
jgi:very-short-patch-repair endonuclease